MNKQERKGLGFISTKRNKVDECRKTKRNYLELRLNKNKKDPMWDIW